MDADPPDDVRPPDELDVIDSILLPVLDSHGLGGWALPCAVDLMNALAAAGAVVVFGDGLPMGTRLVYEPELGYDERGAVIETGEGSWRVLTDKGDDHR